MLETLSYIAGILSLPLHVIAVVLAYKAYRTYKKLSEETTFPASKVSSRQQFGFDRYGSYRTRRIPSAILGAMLGILIPTFVVLIILVLTSLQAR